MFFLMFASIFNVDAFAQPPLTVKVDSFATVGRATTAAEICGHIVGPVKSAQQILMVSDPKSKTPGKYVVSSTSSGEFCSIIATGYGEADVSIVGSTAEVGAAPVEIGIERQ
jgi:hypothetical protein